MCFKKPAAVPGLEAACCKADDCRTTPCTGREDQLELHFALSRSRNELVTLQPLKPPSTSNVAWHQELRMIVAQLGQLSSPL